MMTLRDAADKMRRERSTRVVNEAGEEMVMIGIMTMVMMMEVYGLFLSEYSCDRRGLETRASDAIVL